MNQELSLKFKVKVFFVKLIISLLVFSAIYVIWNIVYFPYTRQYVYTYMETCNVLDFQEIEGALVYVSEIGQSYAVRTFAPSAVLSRYRLETYREYTNTFVTAVQGRFRYFVLEIEQAAIGYVPSGPHRIQVHHIIGLIGFIICSMKLCTLVHQCNMKRRANQSS